MITDHRSLCELSLDQLVICLPYVLKKRRLSTINFVNSKTSICPDINSPYLLLCISCSV